MEQIVACIPVRLCPDNPGQRLGADSSYEKSTCDNCGEECWLGFKSKVFVEAGYMKWCMICCAKAFPNAPIVRLDQVQA